MLDITTGVRDWLATGQGAEPAAGFVPPAVFVDMPSAEVVAEIRRHPRYGDAVRASALTMINQYQGNRLINHLTNDRGRFILAILSAYLYHTHQPDDPSTGLTAARLKELCAETGLCSPGRAAALVALMRWGGYLEPLAAGADRRLKLLRPTEHLLAIHRERWRGQLSAAALVLRQAREALAHFDHPAFSPAYTVAYTGNFINGLRLYRHASGVMFFSYYNAGLLILLELVLMRDSADGEIPISASALARKFHVSRPHVTGLLRKAEAEGLVALSGKTNVALRILPKLADDIAMFFPMMFLMHAACGRYAAEVVHGASRTRNVT